MTTAGTPLAPAAPRADVSRARSYRIFVRDLVLPWRIGIYDHEQTADQRVRINIDLEVREAERFDADTYAQVVCYAEVVDGVRRLAADGHINLVETLASRVADLCLADHRVRRATVRAEKLDAIADVASVGIEITRAQDDSDDPGDASERVVRMIGDPAP